MSVCLWRFEPALGCAVREVVPTRKCQLAHTVSRVLEGFLLETFSLIGERVVNFEFGSVLFNIYSINSLIHALRTVLEIKNRPHTKAHHSVRPDQRAPRSSLITANGDVFACRRVGR